MGTIYEIICWTTGLRYVGKTTKSLKKRLRQHIYCFINIQNRTSTLVLEHGNYDIYELEIVDDEDMLSEREFYYIQHTDCINIVDGTYDDKEYRKEYRKEYYEANKEAISEKNREYREKKGEELLEKKREYYKANREAILENKREKYKCKCGSTISKGKKARHERSKTHLDWLATQA